MSVSPFCKYAGHFRNFIFSFNSAILCPIPNFGVHYLYLKTLFAQNPTSSYLHFPPTRSEQVDRFYVWLEEDVTYLMLFVAFEI
jgi:hypothetical protein